MSPVQVVDRLAAVDRDEWDRLAEYFNTVTYAPVRYAGKTGLEPIHLGTGAWEAKGFRGATTRPLWSAVIPVRNGQSTTGIESVDPDSVDGWTAEISARGMRVDPAEWEALCNGIPGGVGVESG